MKCSRCERDNPAHAKFCVGCGARLALACARCATELPADASFCLECGHPVGASPARRYGSPEAYTPKRLAEKILTSRGALEGERKQVTVLFADLKGSMELLADRDPEDARAILDPVLAHMMDAVHRYEGTVNQVMGDGIMALFGAPLAHEDHAIRACYAALRMQESVRRYADEVRRSHGVTVQIRVGLNSGEVVVGAIGGDLRMDYTAVGQTTHLAARMEQMAAPGSILLAAPTVDLAEGFIQVDSLGPMPIRGLEAPVHVYQLTGASPERSRLHATASRGLTRFVGRDAELDQLRQSLEQARAGRGQVVAVLGEPGVGKSRLYWEFTHSHRTQGWLVLESSSVSYGRATPYLPVIDLLRTYFQIEPRDDVRTIREKVTGKALSLDRQLEPVLPALLSLLDVPVEDAGWERLDPTQRRQRTLDAVKRLVLRESQVQPLLVLFEDLHWIDAGTQALLDGLVESLPTARLLLLVNYRPEYQHAWSSKTYYRQLRIDPLPPAGAEELLHPLLGDDRSLDPLKRLLIERTEGNPLFLEESVRALVETQVLIGDRGSYRLARDPSAIQVPATVQAILAARIDRLANEDKRLLQTASVIGKDVPLALLEAVAELPEDVLRECLGRFQSAEFLYEASLFPEPEYTFKHALTHEVAYRSLLQERRQALHARIVDAMETLYTGRLAEHVERLAHHALHGSVTEKAVLYLRQAGARAVARSANHEAVEFFRQALQVLATLPETREALTEALDVQLALGPALMASTGPATPELETFYQRTREQAARLGDSTRLFTALWGQWYTTNARGPGQAARELGEELLRVATSTGDSGLILEGHHSIWSSCYVLGDLPATAEHHERGLALYDSRQHHAQTFLYGGHDPGVCCLMQSGQVLWALGYPDQALRRTRESLRLAGELGHPFTAMVAHFYGAWAYYSRGESGMAVEMLDAAVRMATGHGFSVWLEQALRLRTAITADRGQVADVLSRLDSALAAARATGWGWKELWAVVPLVAACGKAGHTVKALEIVSEMFTHEYVVSFYGSELCLLQGRLLAAGGDDRAEAALRRATTLARARHARSVELQAATELARLLAQQERRQEARGVLAETYAWFTEGFDTVHLKVAKALLDDLS